ncbi:hypothetical protein YC2023_004591 [Brassica napus]
MSDFLAKADEIGSVYLSLPQFEGGLKMSKPIPPQLATKEMLEEMIAEVYTTQEDMMDDIYRRLDEIYYPIDSRIGWIHKFIENIEERLDQISDTVERQERQRTKGEKAIRSFVGTWFEMSEEDVETCFPTSSSTSPH